MFSRVIRSMQVKINKTTGTKSTGCKKRENNIKDELFI